MSETKTTTVRSVNFSSSTSATLVYTVKFNGKLPEGTTTVGASVKLAHLEPTPVGTTVKVTASIERVRSRRLHFIFSAFDGWGEVAGGHHVRALVDRARFEAGATARAAEPPEEL